MNEELKERWIRALESGEYKQGRARLRTTVYKDAFADDPEVDYYEYCCLGVLGMILQEDGIGQFSRLGGDTFVMNSESTGGRTGHEYLPEGVQGVTGLNMESQCQFGVWNDNDGLSFTEIAAILRENTNNVLDPTFSRTDNDPSVA